MNAPQMAIVYKRQNL